jgi:integrase
MARQLNRLSVKRIEAMKRPGLFCDGGGLYVQVSPEQTKSWVFRYQINHRSRKMGLGEVGRISLNDARKAAYAAHLLVKDGRDPLEERNARKAAVAVERAKLTTFRECALGYIDANKDAWKNAKHASQWLSTLETYAFPVIGKLPVGAVDEGHLMKILGPIWRTKTETASRVRSRIEKILDRAKVMKLRTGDNPAKWTGHLDQLLPHRNQVAPVKHHAALPYKDLPAFMARLRQKASISARCLEFTILTAARTGESIGAKWSEVDFNERTWTVPAIRMKGRKGVARKDHAVPLGDSTLAILRDMPREGDFIFPGAREGKGLSNMALAETLKEMDSPVTVHGFRSTFRDWTADCTEYPNELCEMALAHTVSEKTERAYRRGNMRQRRIRLMQDWCDFCSSTPRAESQKVIELGAR